MQSYILIHTHTSITNVIYLDTTFLGAVAFHKSSAMAKSVLITDRTSSSVGSVAMTETGFATNRRLYSFFVLCVSVSLPTSLS